MRGFVKLFLLTLGLATASAILWCSAAAGRVIALASPLP
jgi:hypothetical protein